INWIRMRDCEFDVVIIGSGIGGLACGNILSNFGYNVCVIEKHFQIGGCLQTFRRNGELFDTGIHYIGSMNEGQVLNRILKYLKVTDTVAFHKLDEEGFDVIHYGDKEYQFAMGLDNFAEKMSTYFPNEAGEIKNYVNYVRNTCDQLPLLNLSSDKPEETAIYNLISNSSFDKIKKITPNKNLQQVLTALNCLHGGRKNETSHYMHSVINKHYIEGAYKIVGGSHQVAMVMGRNIKNNGGRIVIKKEVTKLHVDDKGSIKCAETDDGTKFFAKKFISAIHPVHTLNLVGREHFRKSYWNKIHNLKNSPSFFDVYIILKDNQVPYINHNIYKFYSEDSWAVDQLDHHDQIRDWILYPHLSKPGQKYIKSLSLIKIMKYDFWKKWENTFIDNRGAEYEELKQKIAESMIQDVDEVMPGFKAAVESYFTATPLTLRDYTGSPEGGMYGVSRNCQKALESYIFPRTKIDNLFLSGQNLNLHGMLGVFINALATCGEFIGLEELLKEL
ncbi:MAG: NAD(P)/FAD-dependent oxidoreductase, partial [Bacteroidales bacterium]|nr:NAD(P)/FAD-dependent oxidoreductase [Bacteroidales bacterium]